MPTSPPKSKKTSGKGKKKFVNSTPGQAAAVKGVQPEALPALPADAVNTPAPDPQAGDDPGNVPGSAPLEVAVNAPGGVKGVTVPTWAVVLGGMAVVGSVAGAAWALGRSR